MQFCDGMATESWRGMVVDEIGAVAPSGLEGRFRGRFPRAYARGNWLSPLSRLVKGGCQLSAIGLAAVIHWLIGFLLYLTGALSHTVYALGIVL